MCFDVENECGFEVLMEEHWNVTYWSIAVRKRLLELFCDQISLMLQDMLWQ